jgi:cell division GTPase FtsZ
MKPQDEQPENGPDEPVLNSRDVTILGIGKCGTNLVLSLDRELAKRNDVEFMVCHSKAYEPQRTDHIMSITYNDKTSVEDDHELTPPEKLEKIDYHIEVVEELIFGSNSFIIAAGIGGMAGSYGSGKISEFFSPSWAKIFAFVVMPFAGEGEQRNNDAKVCLADLESFCDIILVVSNQKLLEKWPRDTLGTAFARIERLFDQTVKKVIEARKTDEIGFVLDDPDGLTSIYVNKTPRRDTIDRGRLND